MLRLKGACTDWTSYVEINRPNCLILMRFAKNKGANRFGPVNCHLQAQCRRTLACDTLLTRLESARESLSIAGAAASPSCEVSQTCSIRPSRWRGWFVTLVVEFQMPTTKVPVREPEAVGFDMVLEPPNFLVGSDGGEVRAPRYYRPGKGNCDGRSSSCRGQNGTAAITPKPGGG
jgi:hypothetical protein